jgi:hypothetical protein
LKEFGGEKGKQALLEFDPYLYFTKLEDWEVEEFDYEVGIVNPEGKAYVLGYEEFQPFDFNKFKTFLEDSKVREVKALICHKWVGNHDLGKFSDIVQAICDASDKLTSLNTIFIGDGYDEQYKVSFVNLGDISGILLAYPNLEFLQVCGDGCSLKFQPLHHKNLKTLIIETGYGITSRAIQQICTLELPNLEYLELWLGSDYKYLEEKNSSTLDSLLPIFSGELFPKLKYLGIKSCEYSDELAKVLVRSPLINRLSILDISMAKLTDEGFDILANSSAVNQLYALDVSMNRLSAAAIQKSSQLSCSVKIVPQDTESSRGMRCWSLYE